MGEVYGVNAPNLALTAATAKYMLGVATTAAMDCDWVDFTFGADDDATAGTLLVELVSWTTDGTGTAYTPLKFNGSSQAKAAASSAKVNYTVAPSGTIVVLKSWMFILPLGLFELQMPLGREIHQPISAFWGLRFTSSAACNGFAHIQFEE